MPLAPDAGVRLQDGRTTLGIASHVEVRTRKIRITISSKVTNNDILEKGVLGTDHGPIYR
jgi:hypothetical protein